MFRNVVIVLLLIVIVSLPFLFRQEAPAGDWKEGDPVLVIISPHNEAIRYEFERGFNKWLKEHNKRPVKIDWRNIGGTTEITRYIDSEYASRSKPWLAKNFPKAPEGTNEKLKDAKPDNPEAAAAWTAFRGVDDPNQISIDIDLYFGGGYVDHDAARKKGELVPPWRSDMPKDVSDALSPTTIPSSTSGETWLGHEREESEADKGPVVVFGDAISTFGMVYNIDRLQQLGVTPDHYPRRWTDLADPVYSGQVGVTDPTKSGSIAKAFELIIHTEMRRYVRLTYTDEQIAANEKAIAVWAKTTKPTPTRGVVPDDLKEYEKTVEDGWVEGVQLVQRIGANARYFTDSATKVSIDVSMGDAAVGMTIDFYGRFQAQAMRAPDGTEHMVYVNPEGGTSASCDPISLFRGAPHRQVAEDFIQFVLSREGQKLWTYRTDAEGGPEKYELRRLPIRADFYPDQQNTQYEIDKNRSADAIGDKTVDPYQIAKGFPYVKRWTGDHFGLQRELIRSMCLDSGDELKQAWRAINACKDEKKKAEAMKIMQQLPTVTLTSKDDKHTRSEQPLTWRNGPDIGKNFDQLEYSREWTEAFRAQYRKARDAAQ